MSKSKVKKLVIMGVVCVLLLLGAIWYANTFNDGRLVALTDFSTYIFQFKDIPMIASGCLILIYVLYLVFCWIKLINSNKKQSTPARTRILNPKLGFLGFFGFLGFTGFWSYSVDKTIFPFVFFIFFGYFGFYFEGKMSNTFIDERLHENRNRAQLKALKIGFGMLFIVIWLAGMGLFTRNLEIFCVFLVSATSIIYAITLFLSEYLLYRYDHDDEECDE